MPETLGNRLARFAKEQYGSFSAFAEAVDLTPSGLGHYLKDRQSPGAEVLLRFARTGMNLHWLLTGEGPMMASDAGKGAAQVLGAFKTWAESLSPEEFVGRLKEDGFGEEPDEADTQTENNRDD